MPEVGHVVVIGGGAAGCATAYYLSAAGARVTIVEREGVGSQASGWSAGGLNPLQGMPEPIAALALESHRLHLDLWPELDRLTGRALGGRIISMAHLALDEAMIPALQDVQRAFEAAEGFSAEWLGPAAFRTLEPRITADIAGAVMTRGNGVVDSYLFTATLSEAAQRLGATLAEGTVTGIQHADRRVSGVVLEDRVIACDAVVVAMGPWSQAVEAWLDVPLPIVPLKGEIVRLALGGPPLPFDIVTSDVSLFSRGDDQVWLASTHELRGFDREPSQEAYRTLYEPAVRLMPSLADATLVRQTACLRPLSPDDLPILGAVPGWEGAYVATAGGMKGILLAPGMGKALADLLLTGQTSLSVEACGPARFAAITG